MLRNEYIGERYAIPPPQGTFNVQSEHVGPWWDWLTEYYTSPCWQEKRRLLFLEAHGTCRRCNGVATDAHHVSYVRVGHERWRDLEALCSWCHNHEHHEASRR